MNLVHVVPHIDKEAAGPSYTVPRLCQSLAECGDSVELMCLASREDISGVRLDLHKQWPVLGRFAISTSLARSLRLKVDNVDVVHNHSLWSMVNVAAGWIVPGHRAKLVTSPRGTLSPWALSRTRKLKRILWPMQRRVLSRADLLHATSTVEYQEIRANGFMAPIAIIPNGIDLPNLPRKGPQAAKRTLLFLSRIHPTKGVENLLYAWKRLQEEHDDWRLVIAGPGDPWYVREVMQIAASLKLRNISFPGALYGVEKAQAYREAELFVLPTHSENFGIAVAEALAHACPVVVGRGAPWAAVTSERCGWWIDNDSDTLTYIIGAAMRMSTVDLEEMGMRGRIWMARDYSWKSVGLQMAAAYKWVVYGGEPPACVRVV